MVKFTAGVYDELFAALEYEFGDRALIKRALTHSSRVKTGKDYERLEFLGDRILGLVVAEELYHQNPRQREGQLAVRHSSLVRGEVCAEAARAIGLDRFLAVGLGERSKGLNASRAVLADAMEAVIAAVYLDGGFDAARAFVLKHWKPFLKAGKTVHKDAKTFLQEWALGHALGIPAYRVVGREGPDHSPLFRVEVAIPSREPERGQGQSKRLAEQAAAQAFIAREGLRA